MFSAPKAFEMNTDLVTGAEQNGSTKRRGNATTPNLNKQVQQINDKEENDLTVRNTKNSKQITRKTNNKPKRPESNANSRPNNQVDKHQQNGCASDNKKIKIQVVGDSQLRFVDPKMLSKSDVIIILRENDIDILGLCETRLDETITDSGVFKRGIKFIVMPEMHWLVG